MVTLITYIQENFMILVIVKLHNMLTIFIKSERCFCNVYIDQLSKLSKPLFLHERAAFKPVMEILHRHGFLPSKSGTITTSTVTPNVASRTQSHPDVVVHCFTGSHNELLAYVEAGFYIGISGFFLSPKGAAMKEWLMVRQRELVFVHSLK